MRRTYHPSADSPQKRKTTVNGCISQEIPPEAERMEDRTINGNSAGTTAEYHKRSPAAAPFVTRPAWKIIKSREKRARIDVFIINTPNEDI